jgi:hypothetical protein
MGNYVDQELAQSQQGTDFETEAAWQAHYIKWADILGSLEYRTHADCTPDTSK